jgi:beta-galactosidase/beta-glucuronidase
MEYHNTDHLIEDINQRVYRHVKEQFTEVRAEALGLDRRAGYSIYVNRDYIAVEGDGHMLDYYGGFEYVSSEWVTVVGDFKFYSACDDRVRDHINTYQESLEEETE